MASTSKVKQVSSVPMDSSIADQAWDLAFILEKLRDTECSLLRETRFFDSNTLLHIAASLGHGQIVEAILSKQQCQELLTAKNSCGDIPLHVAVIAGHLPIVQQLLKSSDQCEELLTAKNSIGDIPLHVAVKAGHLPIVQELLKSSDQCEELLTAKNSSGDLPLHVAVNAGLLPIVQELLKSSDQCEELLTAKNSSGDLPLHVAVNAGLLPIVRQLVKSSSCSCKLLKEKNKEGKTPLHLASTKIWRSYDYYEYINPEVAKFLIETVRNAEEYIIMNTLL